MLVIVAICGRLGRHRGRLGLFGGFSRGLRRRDRRIRSRWGLRLITLQLSIFLGGTARNRLRGRCFERFATGLKLQPARFQLQPDRVKFLRS